MSEKIAIQFNRLPILLGYTGCAILIVIGIFPIDDGTYTIVFRTPPGVYFIYALCAVGVAILIWRFPIFVMALAGIPAIAYDGRTVLFRGWNNISIDRAQFVGASFYNRTNRAIIVELNTVRPPIVIDLRYLSRPQDVLPLLERLTGRNIEAG